MGISRNNRRDFLRNLCCVAAGGGVAAMVPQLRMMSTALASTSSLTGYKALICLYLNGGNDSWNMLVPFDATRFNTYTTSRSGTYNSGSNAGGLGLTLPTGAQVALQKVIDTTDSSQYFLHPNLGDISAASTQLTTLFNQKRLAFITNVGPLNKPINKTDYNANSANRPPQLFSHADQTAQWHQGNTKTGTAIGWGGLLAENLAVQGANLTSNPTLPLAISIAGANRFEVGSSSIPYQMSSNGLIGLNGVCNPTPNCNGSAYSGARDAALNDLLTESYSSAFAGEYNTVIGNARNLYTKMGPDLPPTSTAYVPNITWPNTGIASQLKTVATMIKLAKTKGYAQRQIFFVQIGGFDLHSGYWNANSGHPALLGQVAAAMNAFWTAMGTIPGVQSGTTAQDETALFTVSDFARTLQSNGAGSDHAWGSLQMVMSKKVNGGKLYAHGDKLSGFPDQSLSATNSFSRGQMIPGIGVEQYAATLAKWMGVADSNLNAMFPNLSNFTTRDLGFMAP